MPLAKENPPAATPEPEAHHAWSEPMGGADRSCTSCGQPSDDPIHRVPTIGAPSPAMEVIDVFWHDNGAQADRPSQTVPLIMTKALALAIGAGLRFGLDDFIFLSDHYGFSEWGGPDNGESFYIIACALPNRSAVASFDAWRNQR